ncbi:MAG: hypothetical protein HY926_08915 [Elusimicrobia bacterium]|nr:hypothetical protein [Elusimicrobiota bacterium]
MARRWLKTHLREGLRLRDSLAISPRDQSYEDHEKGMEGYDVARASSPETILRSYFYGAQYGRLERCYGFICECAFPAGQPILSLACGNCAIETKLLMDGRDLVLSDLSRGGFVDAVLRLFPSARFGSLDILAGGRLPGKRPQIVLAMNLIYLFDAAQLSRMFGNIRGLLPEGGHLVLDSAGSPPHWLPVFIKNHWTFWEGYPRAVLKSLKTRRRYWPQRQDFGWMHESEEIVSSAEAQGFRLVKRRDYCHGIDFARIYPIYKLLSVFPALMPAFALCGRILGIPHTRMFLFEAVGDINPDPASTGRRSRRRDTSP